LEVIEKQENKTYEASGMTERGKNQSNLACACVRFYDHLFTWKRFLSQRSFQSWKISQQHQTEILYMSAAIVD